MAQNPLLGSRISLISKKNIRYEGVLYSINEANATVALQNVKSFGTEGREKLDPENTAFVAPQDGIHAYLLFRGCDIKDLHVHEQKTELTTVDPAAAGAATATTAPPQPEPVPAPAEGHQPSTSAVTKSEPAAAATAKAVPEKPEAGGKTNTATSSSKNKNNNNNNVPKEEGRGGRGGGGGGKTNMVGSGASLLNRKARGTVEGGLGPENVDGDFDFQAKLEEFEGDDDDSADEAGDDPGAAYDKDDFFDSISCDALDKEAGIDNRLRGSQERNLNLDTFGAVALNNSRRRGRGGGRGRGRGGGRGRGRGGRGRGRGRGRSSSREGSWNNDGNNRNNGTQSAATES